MDPQQFIVPLGLTIASEDDAYGPYVALSRKQWADLADTIPWTLDSDTLARLRGLGDPTDHAEVLEVYDAAGRRATVQVQRHGDRSVVQLPSTPGTYLVVLRHHGVDRVERVVRP